MHTRLDVVLLQDDDCADDTHKRVVSLWDKMISESEIAERLAVIREFGARKRLGLFSGKISPTTKISPLLDIAAEGQGVLLLTDSAGVSISIHHTPGVPSKQRTRELELHWSFGDPQRTVTRFEAEVAGIISREQDFELIHAFKRVLDGLPPLPPDWTETFKIDEPAVIQLFKHQEVAIAAWEQRDRRGIFQMCTGAGKTIASLAAVRRIAEEVLKEKKPMPPVLVTVPTRILADQWVKEIRKLGFTSILEGYNAASNWLDFLEPWMTETTAELPRFVVSTYRTFSDPRFRARLIQAQQSGARAIWIADEMHNLSSPRLAAAMADIATLCPYRLGLSATPEIEGDYAATERLLRYFNGVCASYELRDGIADGVLCPYRYFPKPAYLSPTTGEKYLRLLRQIDQTSSSSTSLLDLYRQSRELIRTSGVQIAAFKELLSALRTGDRRLTHTLVYCPPGYGSYGGDGTDEIDVDETDRRLLEDVVKYLREEGFSVSSILGDTSAEQREFRLQKFKAGELQIICAIGCLDEGVDVPAIERAIVLYSVDRLKQFVQRRGRILRIPRGVRNKIAEIYDIVVLPHGSTLPASQAAELLQKEMRRYSEFARLSLNRADAQIVIEHALSVATEFHRT